MSGHEDPQADPRDLRSGVYESDRFHSAGSSPSSLSNTSISHLAAPQCTIPNHEERNLRLAERKIDLVGRVSSELRHSDEADANRLDNAPVALLVLLVLSSVVLADALATGAGQR
jgi:hypothetical protein